MSTTSAVLDPLLDEGARPPAPPRREEEPPRPSGGDLTAPPVSNARIAMLALIVFESMLFAGLLGGYVVLRWGSDRAWPPSGQPYLPLALTWLNTAVLLGSCVPLSRGIRVFRGWRGSVVASSRSFAGSLVLASGLGALFLAVQGYEWVRLLARGMTVANGTYGAVFLILIGTHGAHVLGAVLWLAIVALLAARGRIAPPDSPALDMVAMYWYFVCAVWVVLFPLVYLA